MLKSVGMTRGGFDRMMNYECLLYGFKGLLYGLPVSIGVTWLIYRAVNEGVSVAFHLPWYSVVIAVGSVFVVVFAKCVGCSLPLLAEKVGLDPAVMASPFISTIVDATSLLIYFSFASALLGI